MRRVTWSKAAERDYLDILCYASAESSDSGERLSDAIEATSNKLADFATGHPGRVSGTYEKSVPRLPYIIAYALTGNDTAVSILRVIHTSRDWQEESWPER